MIPETRKPQNIIHLILVAWFVGRYNSKKPNTNTVPMNVLNDAVKPESRFSISRYPDRNKIIPKYFLIATIALG
jgi:hypothetical protein